MEIFPFLKTDLRKRGRERERDTHTHINRQRETSRPREVIYFST